MISISTTTSNANGSVIIKGYHDLRDNQARIVRTATLDGGVYINHSGVADGDRTLNIRGKISESNGNKLWDIFNNYTTVLVSIPDGIYTAAIRKLKIEYGIVNITIYLENKEND